MSRSIDFREVVFVSTCFYTNTAAGGELSWISPQVVNVRRYDSLQSWIILIALNIKIFKNRKICFFVEVLGLF